jgi:chemotaxis protein methyltransferase CheR
MRLFQDLMYSSCGIRIPDSKKALVQARLKKRLDLLGIANYQGYFHFITDPLHHNELQRAIGLLTTNETFFFRHKLHWDYLCTEILPRVKQEKKRTFSLWSAASSSGEEAYSAAILLFEHFKDYNCQFNVYGSDINVSVLEKARIGKYGPYALQKVTPLCLKKYFVRDQNSDLFCVSPSVKSCTSFKTQNLLSVEHSCQFDVIFLRNVLIYFDSASKTKVVKNIIRALKNSGTLFLGGAETLGSEHSQLIQIHPTIYKKIA